MSHTVDVTSPSTSWQKVAQYIANGIRSGDVAEGEKIASYRKLTEECHASLGSVRRAIEYFQRIGVLQGFHGAGVFVVRKPTDDELDFSSVTTAEITGRLDVLEKTVDDLRGDHADLRESVGAIEAKLIEIYAHLGRGGNDEQEQQPGRGKRRAANS